MKDAPLIRDYSEDWFPQEETGFKCSICGGIIYSGEYYITNYDGEKTHEVCLEEMSRADRYEWLGSELHCRV